MKLCILIEKSEKDMGKKTSSSAALETVSGLVYSASFACFAP